MPTSSIFLPGCRRNILARGVDLLPGLLMSTVLAVSAQGLASLPLMRDLGLSALPLAILLGLLVGNVAPTHLLWLDAGVQFAKGRCLKLGVALFGFHITWQEIAAVGVGGMALALAMVFSTFVLTVSTGTRWLKLERSTCLLIGAGASICGAAAVLATADIARARTEQVTIAITTVVLFGTFTMFCYPALFSHLGLTEPVYGQLMGATIHEVAQVVAAGEAVGRIALQTAVIEKMMRVLLLAPFLLMLSAYVVRTAAAPTTSGPRICIPWFALGFVVLAALNSLHWLPAPTVQYILRLDAALLALAMAALGLDTRFVSILQAGWRPLLLAAIATLFLMGAGYGLSLWWL